jgi:hypothetical protein
VKARHPRSLLQNRPLGKGTGTAVRRYDALVRRSDLAFLSALLLALLVACPAKREQSPDTQTPDSNGQPEPPFPCQKDSDCTPPACGPCTPGAELVQQSRVCVVNPCPNVRVGCSAHKTCVVVP